MSIISPDPDWNSGMPSPDISSPLLPVARAMRRLSYLGCPLTILDEDNKNGAFIKFRVVERPLLRFASITALPYLVFVAAIFVFYFAFDLNVFDILPAMQAHGFAVMDILAMVGLYLPVFVASVMQYRAVRRACDKLSIFSLEVSSLKGIEISPKEAEDHFKVTSRHLCVMTSGSVFSAFLYSYMALAVQSTSWNFSSFAFCLCLYGIIASLTFTPPVLLLTYLLPQHSLGMVELALKKCADKFSDKFDVIVEAKAVGEEEIKDLVDTSLHLSRMVDSMGEALGMVMRVETILTAISGTFGFYFGTIIISAFTGGEFNQMLFIGGLDFLIIGIITTVRLVKLLQKGQGISDQVNRIKALLRNVLLYQVPTANESKRIIHLLDKWSTGGAPVRPCDLFDLNQSTGMAIAGVLLTYVVVLLQFKHGG